MKKHMDEYIQIFAERGYDSTLLKQPVISYANDFVTVAFISPPKANDFKEFQDNGWEFMMISEKRYINSYIDYSEVTFKRNDFSATKPEKVEV